MPGRKLHDMDKPIVRKVKADDHYIDMEDEDGMPIAQNLEGGFDNEEMQIEIPEG